MQDPLDNQDSCSARSSLRLLAAPDAQRWYDQEGDYLEVLFAFARKAGYFRATENDAVMEKVDREGNLLGFSILNVSALRGQYLSISLKKHTA